MKYTHLKAADYVTSTWSGGTTTQLGIAPCGAVYADRDFLWRVSSATVDLEVSDFTALPDYDRLIATVEGEIDVSHNGGQAIHLAPYQVHAFDGGWETRSVGRCRDFNLMTRKGRCFGQMTALKGSGTLRVDEAADAFAHTDAIVYCGHGTAAVLLEGTAIALPQGEALRFEQAAGLELTVTGDTKVFLAAAWY